MRKLHSLKTHLQLFFILFMMAANLVGLSLIVGTGIQPPVVVAQGPLTSPGPPLNTFSVETLEVYGLSLEEIQAAGSFTLNVTVSANPTTVSAGQPVTFTITIANLGPDPAQYILFSQRLPSCMSGGTPVFGPGITYVKDNNASPTYLLTNPIPVSGSVQITVSATPSSTCNTLVTYQARVDPFENQQSSNIFSANVNVLNGWLLTYLPLIRLDPTPTPLPYVFYDDFSTNQGWSIADDDDCSRSRIDGEYEIKAKTKDKNCFSPAPEEAERKFGTFKVKVRRASGSSSFTVAIYANGSGGETYYALEVKPNDSCGWKLIRLKSGSSKTLRSGGCDSAINRGSNANILELRHLGDNISAFINGTQMGSTYSDSSDLDGKGTGVYTRTGKDDDVTVRFDDFTVIQP